MKVEIKPTADGNYTVDGLEVRELDDGQWKGNPEMNSQQVAAFQRHLQAVKQHNAPVECDYQI